MVHRHFQAAILYKLRATFLKAHRDDTIVFSNHSTLNFHSIFFITTRWFIEIRNEHAGDGNRQRSTFTARHYQNRHRQP